MKFKKFALLLIMAVSFGFFFNACEETTSTEDGPIIDSIDPITGVAGTVVTITGSNFGEPEDYTQATHKVYFNGELASIKVIGTEIQWFDDEIQVEVPTRATTGAVTVEVNGKQSNGVNFTVPSAKPAVGLMATSVDKDKVALKWTLSADESNSNFVGYWLYVYVPGGQMGDPIELQKGYNTTTITGLTEGTIYNFDLYAVVKYNNQDMLSPKVTIQWAPAIRFNMNVNDDVIKVYESASSLGSGLVLKDAQGNAPKTLTVANGANWDLGLYTNGGVVEFGSAKNILAKYSSFSGTAKKCEISDTRYDVALLNDVYDSQALSGQTYSEQIINLATATASNNLVFVVRTNAPSWNYAKVMVLNKSGFLQGSTGNRYIEVVVSYQSVQGVPYAF